MCVALLAGMLAACAGPGRFTIALGARDIQQRIDRHFPVRRRKLFFEVRLDGPQVVLNSTTNRVELSLRVTGLVATVPVGRARARVTGGVRYDAHRHEFLLTDPRIVDFEVSHLPKERIEPVRAVVDRFVNRVLPAIPLYRLEGSEHRLARAVLKRVWLSDGKLLLQMGL